MLPRVKGCCQAGDFVRAIAVSVRISIPSDTLCKEAIGRTISSSVFVNPLKGDRRKSAEIRLTIYCSLGVLSSFLSSLSCDDVPFDVRAFLFSSGRSQLFALSSCSSRFKGYRWFGKEAVSCWQRQEVNVCVCMQWVFMLCVLLNE